MTRTREENARDLEREEWPIDYICPECSSTNIVFEAPVYWSAPEQKFVCTDTPLMKSGSGHICNACEEEIDPQQVYLCKGCRRPEAECSKDPCDNIKQWRLT